MTQQTDVETILVVDDEPGIIRAIQSLLKKNGYRVVTASSGQEALDIVRDARPDLIILDVNMPGINGYETCRRLKTIKALEKVPVLHLSGRTEVQDKVAGFEAGGIDYIAKPFESQEVLARVKIHLTLRRSGRQLELSAMASDEKYKALVESTRDIPFSTDQAGRLTFLGPQASRYGIDSESAISKHLLDVVVPKNKDRLLERHQQAVAQEADLNFELEIVDSDGRTRWFEERGVVIRNAEGDVISISGALRDITERKAAEQEIQRHRSHLSDLVEQRTQALLERTQELERFNRAMVGREQRLIELKKEVNRLSVELGREPPYPRWKQDTNDG